MGKKLALVFMAACWLACAVAGGTPGEPAAQSRAAGAALDDFLARMDARSLELETLEADLSYSRRENFSGRESVSTGKMQVRKPSQMHIEFTEPYPRHIWIDEDYIVDYKVDLNSAEKIELSAENRPEIIGLSTRFGELRDDFTMSLEIPGGDHPSSYILTLEPAEGHDADFTSAEVEVDAESLLPVRVVEKNSRLDVDKTFAFSDIRENPRLQARLFEPRLRRDTAVTVRERGDGKGPSPARASGPAHDRAARPRALVAGFRRKPRRPPVTSLDGQSSCIRSGGEGAPTWRR